MEIIKKYFPKLTEKQLASFGELEGLYKEWNDKINVISRKDIDNLYERHVLHSLAIAKFISFRDGSEVMDLGTGGGFPAIPLAILFPDVQFYAIDRIKKKIGVVQTMIDHLGLSNLKAEQLTAEEDKRQYDFVVTRAVAKLDKLILWSEKLIKPDQINATPNGLIALKGGSYQEEKKGVNKYLEQCPLSDYFSEEFFKTKYLVYAQLV